jgi:hypothetical protein
MLPVKITSNEGIFFPDEKKVVELRNSETSTADEYC